MKPSFTGVETRKRRQNEGSPSPESPKRNKVHAQRKFAQGVGPPVTPVRNRERDVARQNVTPPVEPVINNPVPTTEGFINYLCFRGSPLLPAELKYLLDGDFALQATASTSSQQKSAAKKNVKKKVVAKKPSSAVQALLQKYQKQRIAKQKAATTVATLARKVKGKNLARSRSETAEVAAKTKKEVVKRRVVGLRSGLKRSTPVVAVVTKKKKKKKLLRAGLRSGARAIEPKTSAKEIKKSVVSAKKMEITEKEKTEVKPVRKKKPRGDVGSDFSSDDNEPLLTRKRPSRITRSPLKKQGESSRPRRLRNLASNNAVSLTKKEDEQLTVEASQSPSTRRAALEKRETEVKSSPIKKKITATSTPKATITPKPSKVQTAKVDVRKTSKLDKPLKKDVSLDKPSKKDVTLDKLLRKDASLDKSSKKDVSLDKLSKKDVTLDKLLKRDASSDKSSKKDVSLDKPSKKDVTLDKLLKKDTSLDKSSNKDVTLDKLLKKVVSMDKPLKKDVSMTRPSTRSRTPGLKSSTIHKPAITSLIQKKKLHSLRTLTRLERTKRLQKSSEKKPDEFKPTTKISSTKETLPSTSKEQESSVRTLRKKIEDVPEKASTQKKVPKKVVESSKPATAKKSLPKDVQKEDTSAEPPKRPSRKCSTVDKMWIDIDGFTSDEEDFIDVESLAEGKNKSEDAANTDNAASKPGTAGSSCQMKVLRKNSTTSTTSADSSKSSKAKHSGSTAKREQTSSNAQNKTSTDSQKNEESSSGKGSGSSKNDVKESSAKSDTSQCKVTEAGAVSTNSVIDNILASLSSGLEDSEKTPTSSATKPAIAGKNSSAPQKSSDSEQDVKPIASSSILNSEKLSTKSVAVTPISIKSDEENSKGAEFSSPAKCASPKQPFLSSSIMDLFPSHNTSVPPTISPKVEVSSTLTSALFSNLQMKNIPDNVTSPQKSFGRDTQETKGTPPKELIPLLPLFPNLSTKKPAQVDFGSRTLNTPAVGSPPRQPSVCSTSGLSTPKSTPVSPQPKSVCDSSSDAVRDLSLNKYDFEPAKASLVSYSKPNTSSSSQISPTSTSRSPNKPAVSSSLHHVTSSSCVSSSVVSSTSSTPQKPRTAQDESHSLIARLAASVARSALANKSGLDFKPFNKDVKNISMCTDRVKEESSDSFKFEDDPLLDDKKSSPLPTDVKESEKSKIPKIFPKLTATLTPRDFTNSELFPKVCSENSQPKALFPSRIPIDQDDKLPASFLEAPPEASSSKSNAAKPKDKDCDSRTKSSSPYSSQKRNPRAKRSISTSSTDDSKGSSRKYRSKNDEKRNRGEAKVRKPKDTSRNSRPQPSPETVTRRERPKRQCSRVSRSWIDRDSDDSNYYDDEEEDYLELIRQSELAEKAKKLDETKAKRISSESEPEQDRDSDNFSDSDDEPLKKKSRSSPIPEVRTAFSPNKNVESPTQSNVSQMCNIPPMMKVPPINTHGLDLLSEVVTGAEKIPSLIEQWLEESARSESGSAFPGFESSEIPPATKIPSDLSPNIPDPLVQFVRATADAPRLKVPEDQEKQSKKPAAKAETVLRRPPVSSVQDLLKLQKERRLSPKPQPESHSGNCKCNSCVVKKAWFKNKPMPPSSSKESSAVATPFQSLTKAFGTSTSGKASASVAPYVQSPTSSDSKSPSPQRKLSFLERMRERERKESAAKINPRPFSPHNESSVYAFEPEAEQIKPKSRPSQRNADASTHSDVDEERQRLPGTSIAVQVDFDTMSKSQPEPPTIIDDGKSIEISTQTEVAEDDTDSPMFYIPLQQSANASTSNQALIQGVALKLGTEGPSGPNQRVIMKAKLVTAATATPSIKAVVMPQQKLSDPPKNTLPVGTVQPTARRPQPTALSQGKAGGKEDFPLASTSRVRKSGKVDAVQVSSPKNTGGASKSAEASGIPQGSEKEPLKSASSTQCSSPVLKRLESKGEKGSATLVEAPTFYLTEKEFNDPLEFFERIRPEAERFGLCRIVPPSSFKPDCKVADDMRFTAYNQYVHRMFHRLGPNARETMAMKKYLKTQSISLKPPPCIGGMEVDLPRLYKAVQTCGGLMKVIERQKWQHIADMLRFPKAAHDLATKLDSIYCQYLLPYETLKPEEREQLLKEVDVDWEAHQEKEATDTDDDEEEENYIEECEECIVKGRTMALNQFYRIARNTMSMWFKSSEPSPAQVESEFWRHVTERTNHVCVHSGSIDSSGWGYGFPVGKNVFAKHPWNLKVLTNNSGSILRSLGPVMGVTVPTLHVGMVFAAFCWYRDPHGLPWVEYLHTGAPKIWYGISDDNSEQFRDALTKLLPRHIKDQRIWLPCDTAMAPPESLAELGVPLSRTTQEPGQFVLIFPRAFTSSLCTGYLVSESVYFARPSWLETAEQVFQDIHDSAEPSVFSLDNLLFSIAADTRASLENLQMVLPMVQRLRERELNGRKALDDLKITRQRLQREASRRRGKQSEPEPEEECDQCRASLFLSLVKISADESTFCLPHALQHLSANAEQLSNSKLLFAYDEDEINQVVDQLQMRIEAKILKGKK